MIVNRSFGGLMLLTIAVCIVMISCRDESKRPYAFEVLGSDETGLDFSNTLHSSDSFNLFKYMYFYNGAGVGVGDFNNDGLQDVFFASNQGDNSLFLNKGNMQFRNVTKEASIPSDNAWSTGVSVVDINSDGLLDIYVSRVGKYRVLNSSNQFLVCQGIKDGIPQYTDKAKDYGLDFSGFGTQAAFFDYDLDGDLDAFLLNHSIHEAGNFRARKEFIGTHNALAGGKLFRNDSLKFSDISATSGVTSTAIGYGLGIVVSDINSDGYPDVYIGNDFHENDYLYINQKNGTFKDLSDSCLMHTSRYTMGVDVADANNDGLPDIVSVDMLPADPYILKRSPGEDSYDVFNLKIKYGYNYQYTRNALQFNRGNGHFSETGLYSGVAATDWSWAPLFVDFDNDGLKDLFISNGIPKRLNDIDYINYISDQSIQQKIKDNKIDEKDRTLIDKFPQIKIPNKFYRNAGNMMFEDIHESVEDASTYSNGAAYADFDNDGDMDVVVNNIDDKALIYRNKSNDKKDNNFIDINLNGPPGNRNAIGAKVILFSPGKTERYEKFPVRGFLSSMEVPIHIGASGSKIDSAILIWPDNTYEKFSFSNRETIEATYSKGLPVYVYGEKKRVDSVYQVANITAETGINFLHKENSFPEFDREPLIPHMISTEGPALAVADVDRNGLDDVFIGAAKGRARGLFMQQPGGKFSQKELPALHADSNYEDVDAQWVDVNNDSNTDLIIASGGNEYYGQDAHLLPRIYLNDGSGNLTRKSDAISGIYETSGCITANDINGDGFVDLFIGGRGIPWQFGADTRSYLLLNDGTGKFSDQTDKFCSPLKNAGFVTGAVWVDINNDNKKDLVTCSEWGTIDAYIHHGNKFEKKTLTNKKGWWNFILPVDVDGDGKMDLVAGNVGLNSRLKASEKEPVRLYYNDFDENGKKEQVLTYYLNGKEIPFASKGEMERQLPVLRKRFNYAKDFAAASLQDIVSSDKLSEAAHFTADYFSNSVLLNKGNLQFEMSPLPWEAQLTSFRNGVVLNANGDQYPDVLLVGNYYENNIEMGRYDADYGSLLINNGKGGFDYKTLKGAAIKGQSRRIQKLKIGTREGFVIARNNDSAVVISFVK